MNREDTSIDKLSRAFNYESQFRNAVAADSLTFFDINLSLDLIENDFFFREKDGDFYSVLEFLGLSAPCSFSDFVSTWIEKMIPEASRKTIPFIDSMREHMISMYNNGKRDLSIGYWAESPFGEKFYFNHIFLLLKNENNEICAFSVIKDYTNEISISEKSRFSLLEQYAYIDPVTSGYNYVKFKEQVRKYNTEGVIISVDVHSFKIVNSISGTVKGDEVIKKMWNVILNLLEIQNKELAAHINADHFIIFMPTFDREKIIRRIKNITYALSIISSELDVPVLRPYFGIAAWEKGKKIELSYSESVVAKKKARDLTDVNYSFFEQRDNEKIFEEKAVIDGFETALAKKDFKIFFQPKYSPTTKQLVGAEALIRWQTDDGNIKPPSSFIPIFEQNGMIRTLDEYVFRNVCQQLKEWQNKGKYVVPVSVNLSRASLYYKNVVEQYKRITDEIGIDRKFVPLEITESATVANNDIKMIADEFFKAGFAIHMDDFGTGYSSFASLNVIHINTLKLDKSLIDYIGNFGGNRMIEHTISLAKELGLHVTAEGVEKEEQVSFLNDVGCDSIQGFYFSKPVGTNDFEKLLSSAPVEEKHCVDSKILNHISDFKQSYFKRPLYSFVANVTRDVFDEDCGYYNWRKEKIYQGKSYQEATVKIADEYVTEENRSTYRKMMYRENLLNTFCGSNETRFFEYHRKYAGGIGHFRMMIHLFKLDEFSDLWMYFTVTNLDKE